MSYEAFFHWLTGFLANLNTRKLNCDQIDMINEKIKSVEFYYFQEWERRPTRALSMVNDASPILPKHPCENYKKYIVEYTHE